MDQYCGTYFVNVPVDSDVALIKSVKLEGKPLTLATAVELDAKQPGWRNHEGTPTHYVVIDSDEILLNRKPREFVPNTLSVTLVLKPTKACTDVENFLFNDWHEVIAAGAKKRLLLAPGKKWSNPQLAGVHANEYGKGIVDGSSRARFGWGNRDLQVKRRRIV